MKISYIQCEGNGCQHKGQMEPKTFGGGAVFRWITVTRSCSQSGDKISAGEHHYCSDACLRSAFTGKAVVQLSQEEALKRALERMHLKPETRKGKGQ